eukprot:XP_008680417.1 uncharacterized protein LOC103655441 [Zea mays]
MKPGPLHVTMLATPGLGHLIPLVELAMLLAVRRDIPTMLINFASAASATQRKLGREWIGKCSASITDIRINSSRVVAAVRHLVGDSTRRPHRDSDLPRAAAFETLMT